MKSIGQFVLKVFRPPYNIWGYEPICSFSTKKSLSYPEVDLDENEREVILGLLNSLTVEEMRKIKGVSSSVAMEICKHREVNGSFTVIEELQEVRKVGVKSFNTLCSCLRSGKPELIIDKKDPSAFESVHKLITPVLTKDFLKSVNEVTSLEFGSESIHYTSMTPDFRVTNWNHIPLLNTSFQKQTPVQIVEEAYRTVELLPKSDMYLIESRMIRKLTPSYMQMLLFIKCLQTAVQVLLNPGFATTKEHNVFHMKDSLTVKTFNLRVGNERVSGQHILQQIEDNEYELEVKIPSYLWRHFYRQRSDIVQERYCNSLLIALAFCHHFKDNLQSESKLSLPEEESESEDNFFHKR